MKAPKKTKAGKVKATPVKRREVNEAKNDEEVEAMDTTEFNAQFLEEGNVIVMQVTDDQDKEFPTPSEEEEDSEEEGEISEQMVSTNNNAT